MLLAIITFMSARRACLLRLFTVEYARRTLNVQIVHPMHTVIVKPNELESALCRPLDMSVYEHHQDPAYLAATLCYGIIKSSVAGAWLGLAEPRELSQK